MRKLILYVAMSLDGYLADSQGNVDWLSGHDPQEGNDWYEEFYNSIDTILMGKNTYSQIITQLSPEFWIYQDKMSYVFTHNPGEDTPQVQFIDKNPQDFLRWLKHRKGGDIWLCGGADLIAQCLHADLVDVFHISMIPTILGSGLSLFPPCPEKKLFLESSRHHNGILDVVYRRR